MDGLRHVVRHAHELDVHGRQVVVRCHEVLHDLRHVARPNGDVVGVFLVMFSGESGSPLESCALMLAKEKSTQRRSC